MHAFPPVRLTRYMAESAWRTSSSASTSSTAWAKVRPTLAVTVKS